MVAFGYCSGLTSITIPDSVTSIGNGAFYGCNGLTNITIGNGLSSVDIYAFHLCCENLESITVLSGNATYHSEGNCLIETQSKTLILGCKNSVIPDDGSVTSIGDYAFYVCNFNNNSITIPKCVTSISASAFSSSSNLTEIRFGGTVEEWNNAFKPSLSRFDKKIICSDGEIN